MRAVLESSGVRYHALVDYFSATNNTLVEDMGWGEETARGWKYKAGIEGSGIVAGAWNSLLLHQRL